MNYERSPSGRAEALVERAVARRGLILFHCTALVQVANVAVSFIFVIWIN